MILVIDRNMTLLGQGNSGKSIIEGRILVGKLKFYETLDTDIEKEKGSTIECGMPSFLFGLKMCILKVLSIIRKRKPV